MGRTVSEIVVPYGSNMVAKEWFRRAMALILAPVALLLLLPSVPALAVRSPSLARVKTPTGVTLPGTKCPRVSFEQCLEYVDRGSTGQRAKLDVAGGNGRFVNVPPS